MKVYRYEDRNHCGPFQHAGLNRRFAQLPTAQDVGLPHGNGYASACTDIGTLVKYFGTNNCNDMERMGYRIAEYETTEYLTAVDQLVFNTGSAKFIGWDDEDDE